jgi:hypothetical protein
MLGPDLVLDGIDLRGIRSSVDQHRSFVDFRRGSFDRFADHVAASC